MKKVNFNSLSNFKAPDEWIDKAAAIPEMVEEESALVPFWRNRALVTAASLVLVSVLSLLVYLSFGMKPPVEVKPSTPATEIIWSTDENGATVASEIVVVSDGNSSRDGTQSTEPRSILEQIIDNIFGTGDTSSTTASGSRRGGSTGSHAGTGHGSDTDDTGSSRTDPTTSSNPGESDMFDPTTKTDPTERGKPDPTTKTNPTEGGKTDPTTITASTESGKAPTEAPAPIIDPIMPTSPSATQKPTEAPAPTSAPTSPSATQAPTELYKPPTNYKIYATVNLLPDMSETPAYEVEDDAKVFCCLYDVSGNIVGSKYYNDREKAAKILSVNPDGSYNVVYDPVENGLHIDSGRYDYVFYNWFGEELLRGTVEY